MTYRSLLAGLLACAALDVAHAADQTIRGTSLVIKDRSTPTRRKIVVKAKETQSDDTIVGDPVADGAMVTITASGGTPSAETYPLPTGTSPTTLEPFWTGDLTKGFKYRDSKGDNGPVKRALLKLKNGTFQLKVAIDGKLGPIAVTPPDPGTDACVLFAIVGGDSYSVAFATGQLTNKGPLLFKVAKPTAERSCVPPTTTSTSTSSSTSTSTTTSTVTTTNTTTTLALPFLDPPGPAPLRYRDPVFAMVGLTSNVVYGSAVNNSGQTVTLLLDLYEPVGDAVTARPAIVWVHGGSFATGDKTSAELVDEANTFAMKGYVNASINYRLEPPGCTSVTPLCLIAIVEALEDAQAAVRFLRANAATIGIDPGRIAIGGSSAGAITALNVGFGSSDDPTAAVGAAVSLSGGLLSGGVDGGDAPILLFHGTADTIVPYQWAVNAYNAAVAAGLDAFLTTWVGAGHVPYVQHRTEILDQTRNFLYWELDLVNAAQ